jgi:pantothenate kinase type III
VKVLLVDLGNTRIKWARLGPRGVGRQKAAAHAGWQAADFSRALFGSAARDALASGIRVVAVSVASEPLRRAFAEPCAPRPGERRCSARA